MTPGTGKADRALTSLAHRLALLGATGAWAGPTVFVLALGVSVGLSSSLIIIALSPAPLDQPFEAVLSTLAGAAVGAIGTYLGVNRSLGPPPEAGAGGADSDADGPDSTQDSQQPPGGAGPPLPRQRPGDGT